MEKRKRETVKVLKREKMELGNSMKSNAHVWQPAWLNIQDVALVPGKHRFKMIYPLKQGAEWW